MNKHLDKKGQSLILFILFLPVLLMSLALIVDVGLMYNAKIKGEALLNDAIKNSLNIEEYFEINDLKVKSLEEKNECTIIHTDINSIFGNLIGYDTYDIEITNC